MLLWFGFAVLTAGVVAVLLRPLLRGRVDVRADDEATADMAVYRDQLSEIGADQDRGLITAEEAEAARTELARRLIRAADGQSAGTPPSRHDNISGGLASDHGARLPVYMVGALLPLVALGVYLGIGAPDLPGQPHAERVRSAAGVRSVEDLVGLVEKRLREQPDDGQGWEVIAPVYVKAGRFREAANAYGNAIRVLGESPKRLLGLSEALILANNGLVAEDARKVLLRLRGLDPQRPEPAFWLAMAKEQDGDIQGAVSDLEAMLKSAPADAEWKPDLEKQIGELRAKVAGGRAGAPAVAEGPQQSKPAAGVAGPGNPAVVGTGGGSVRGPSEEAISAAQQMSPEQRNAMIENMVSGLAARLATSGRDLEGWQRLARAYKVMGRDGDARAAIAKARTNFDGDAAAQSALDELAKSLGLGT